MPHVTRLLVLSAFALVACGYASTPVAPSAAPLTGGSYAVLRDGSLPPQRTEVQRLRDSAPRTSDVPATHRACAMSHGGSC
jgi:hypothetical protein